MRRLRRDSSGRLLAGLAVTVGLLLPLAVFGAPALARTGASASEYEYSSSAQYQYRIPICHFTHSKKHPWHTIRISVRAWPAHHRHGDQLGVCTASELQRLKHDHGKGHEQHLSSKAAISHGQGHENGHGNKSHGKGNGD